MLTLGILLAVLGLALVVVEFFLPGGILAILGTAALLGSIAVMAFCIGLAWLFGFVLLLGLLAGAVCQWALYKVKASRKKGSYFHGADQADFRAEAYDIDLQGKRGIVATDLRPSGHIVVEGKRYHAISEEGYLPRGVEVMIVRIEGARTIVQKISI